jgi:hypothetical protein
MAVSPVSYHKNSKIRKRSPSFEDHYSQATLFWNSMSDRVAAWAEGVDLSATHRSTTRACRTTAWSRTRG